MGVGSGVAIGTRVMVGTGVSATTTLRVGDGVIVGTGVAAEEVVAVVAAMTRGVGVEVGPIVLIGVTLGVSAPQARIIIRNPTSTNPESTEGRPWGQPLKKPAGAPLNLG